ncbi:MAG: trypsin-like serine protease [Cyanosarcina radialis HA8281-LM2]|jgi:V8-like Glu-specific endopeptidase|nr:trypsin-like serine protease [Cyanosarcina radialis HA8281-LM2]
MKIIKERSQIEPMTPLEQAKQEPKLGVQDWFRLRQERYPVLDSKQQKAFGGVVLSREELLKENKKMVSLPSFVPDEAPILPGGPRSIGRQSQKPLRRFSGAKVIPANFTQIYNGESRSIYYDTSFPWVCIGRLNKPDGTWGTASLVGKNTILTAAHVVSGWWSPGGPVTGNLTFIPAMFGSGSILGATWVANVIGIAAWETPTAVDGYDMAICQIDRPMGDWLGYFGYRTYIDDWEDLSVWTHAGYPYDLSMGGTQPSYELGIAVRDDDSDSYDTLEVETQADIASGQSGGPLWGVFNDQRQIIGTLSGREDNFAEEKNSLFAGGNGLVRLIDWGRNNWG